MQLKKYLPGDDKDILSEIIRVDHSGELGAINIYKGQIAAMRHIRRDEVAVINVLNDMYRGEVEHFEYFKKQIEENKIRPSIFIPLWKILGFATGYLSASMGVKSAMTLTVGVETVIGKHYKEQIELIESKLNKQDNLKEKISQFMEDELEHLDKGLDYKAEEVCCHFYLRKLVELATSWAISIAKRF
jgi:ubiquinone biosynthesis monooxygenase Coq7